MLKTRKILSLLTLVVAMATLLPFAGCKKDDPARKTEYSLLVKDVLGVTGTATVTETSSTSITIDLQLFGAPSGSHPAALCMNTAVEGGNVVANLNPVDASGTSSTTVSTITYDQMIAYDGFIKVMKSSTEPNVILAQGDIGGNVITTTNKTYVLDPIGTYGVSGNALFEKRVNGNTLVTISLTGTIGGQSYPASINLSSISTVGGGPVMKLLNNVDGTTGKSYTNIRTLDSGLAITYENWLVYQGYINIYQNSVNLINIICHGNIGSN